MEDQPLEVAPWNRLQLLDRPLDRGSEGVGDAKLDPAGVTGFWIPANVGSWRRGGGHPGST